LDFILILKILTYSVFVSSLFQLRTRSYAFGCLNIGLLIWFMLLSCLPGPLFEHWLSLRDAFLGIPGDAWPHLGAEEDRLWRPSFRRELGCGFFGLWSHLWWSLWVLLWRSLWPISTTPAPWLSNGLVRAHSFQLRRNATKVMRALPRTSSLGQFLANLRDLAPIWSHSIHSPTPLRWPVWDNSALPHILVWCRGPCLLQKW
jgi:hypothetical protein